MTPGEPPTFAEMEERLYSADLDAFVKERSVSVSILAGISDAHRIETMVCRGNESV